MSARIGELLVKTGMLTQEQLEHALEAAQVDAVSVTNKIVALDMLSEDDLLEVMSSQFGVPIIELDGVEIDGSIHSLIPSGVAQKHGMMPVELRDSILVVAMTDPSNILAINDIKFITGYDISVGVASENEIKQQFEKCYEAGPSYDSIIGDMDPEDVEVVEEDEDINLSDLERQTEDAPVVKLVNAILTDAVKKGASDIHVEPYEKVFRVRFRIDGVLYEIMKPPYKLKNALTSRLKIMSALDIAERRLPQDGRIKLKMGKKREMDFRVNVLPTLFGEKVVLRLLDKSNLQLDMTKLGFEVNQLKQFQACIAQPFGMVLVTGPTGSGKTTTLYSGLASLNQVGTNISTAEDPVEFNLAGINQAQMQDDIGFNFAAALRAFLRQDPDIIMVGEIRDYETAEISIKAALTGHLVLSTLHTNDAPSTINRLLNMGIEPFLVASSINCIVAQRLARRICGECKQEVKVASDVLVDIGIAEAEATHITCMAGEGCSKCAGTGYKGRVALYEVLVMKDEIKDYVLNGASAAEIKRESVKQGMMTLRASALMRLKEGVTTVEEVLRCTAAD